MPRRIIIDRDDRTGQDRYFEVNATEPFFRRLMCKLFGHWPGKEEETVIGWQGKYAKFVECARCHATAKTEDNLPGDNHHVIRIADSGYISGWTDAKAGYKNRILESKRWKD